MTAIDASIANIALPTIGRELQRVAGVDRVDCGRVSARDHGHAVHDGVARSIARHGRVWGSGVALFTVGSILCAVSGTFALLIFARVLQGVGAAAIMSLSPALVRDIYPRSQLGHAFGMNAMYTSIASAAGPTVGGMLLAVFPWQILFAINVPLAIVIVLCARNTLPNVPGTGAALDRSASQRVRSASACWSTASTVCARRCALGHRNRIARRCDRVRVVRAPSVYAAGADDLARSLSPAAFLRRRASQLQRLVGLEHRRDRAAVLSPARLRHVAVAVGTAHDVVADCQRDRGTDHRPLRRPLRRRLIATAGLVVSPERSGSTRTRSSIRASRCCSSRSALGRRLGHLPNAEQPRNHGQWSAGKRRSVAAIFASLRVAGQTFGASLAAIVFASFPHDRACRAGKNAYRGARRASACVRAQFRRDVRERAARLPRRLPLHAR